MGTLLTWMLRLFMTFVGLAFLLGLVVALGIYIMWATLRWLLTGRKPQVAMVWQQYSAMRKSFRQGGFHAAHGESGVQGRNDQIVDVEAREIQDEVPRIPRNH